jgi:uncharacterized protein GlcG (DUF336 family)
MTLSLLAAKSIADAAIRRARQLNINVSVAVCDDQGHLIVLNRMDGAKSLADVNRLCIGKAIVSAGTGRPSGEMSSGEMLGVNHTPVDLVVAEGMPAICIQGGLPILRGGKVEGSCGVAGSERCEQDEECARAGIASVEA